MAMGAGDQPGKNSKEVSIGRSHGGHELLDFFGIFQALACFDARAHVNGQ
jgi:hypothetical protein